MNQTIDKDNAKRFDEKNKNKKKNDKKKNKNEFEFCKVCNLNHDQGHRHKYFPSHNKALSAFLSRFQSKLSEVRFFLKNPIVLRPEHASRNRLWCVFCDADVDELGSSFACGNAIHHLASLDHLKKLKHFLWKYGGGMDQIDIFRILDAEVAKWEKKCKALRNETASAIDGSCVLQVGPSNDIHSKLNHKNITNFDKNDFDPLNVSNSVMPLQYNTNEYQISHSGHSAIANVGQIICDAVSSMPIVCSSTRLGNSNEITSNWTSNESQHYNSEICMYNHSNGRVSLVYWFFLFIFF
uniref:TITAN-like protein isoform X1 n=1 Tax=Rhizophora mucronata TaxID=61149 RepID=A0A2P2JTL1_RHIMU